MKQITLFLLLSICVSCTTIRHRPHKSFKWKGVRTVKVNIPDKYFYYVHPKLDMK